MSSKQELVKFWRVMNVDERLIQAFLQIPREEFVPKTFREKAYCDHPLPTLRSQSISQPSTIMIMLKALDVKPGETVFEVGAGGGYQAALLSQLVGQSGKVISTEIIPELVAIAHENLENLGIHNVKVMETDGSEGFLAEGPYDKIIITAACPAIPQPIVDQLKEGGTIVAPVGDINQQMMIKATKIQGRLEFEFLGQFRFVPMRGRFGFEEP